MRRKRHVRSIRFFCNDNPYFGRYNSDGKFDSLVEQEPVDIIGYPITLVLIDSRGETVRVKIEQTGIFVFFVVIGDNGYVPKPEHVYHK